MHTVHMESIIVDNTMCCFWLSILHNESLCVFLCGKLSPDEGAAV